MTSLSLIAVVWCGFATGAEAKPAVGHKDVVLLVQWSADNIEVLERIETPRKTRRGRLRLPRHENITIVGRNVDGKELFRDRIRDPRWIHGEFLAQEGEPSPRHVRLRREFPIVFRIRVPLEPALAEIRFQESVAGVVQGTPAATPARLLATLPLGDGTR